MPRLWIGLFACSAVFGLGFQDPDEGLPPEGAPQARARVIVPRGAAARAVPASVPADPEALEIAGLSRGTKAEVLTWDRIYMLAVVRARSGAGQGMRGAATLDPKRLDEEAKRVGFGDFARFRGEYLAGRGDGPGPFRDPAPAVLELARHARAAEDARRHYLAYIGRFQEAARLSQRAGSGRTSFGVDLIDDALQASRLAAHDRVRRYQDGLDALKVELGLAPEAPVVVDPSILAAFGDVFAAIEAWLDEPAHGFEKFNRIVGGFPRDPGDVMIGGNSLAEDFRQGPAWIEDILRSATRAALAARGDRRSPEGDEATALRVRREVRRLYEDDVEYRAAIRRFVVLVRLADEARATFAAQPARGPDSERAAITEYAAALDRLEQQEDRIVAAWVAYQDDRLALIRDLGAPPAGDWAGFLAPLTARKGDAGPR